MQTMSAMDILHALCEGMRRGKASSITLKKGPTGAVEFKVRADRQVDVRDFYDARVEVEHLLVRSDD